MSKHLAALALILVAGSTALAHCGSAAIIRSRAIVSSAVVVKEAAVVAAVVSPVIVPVAVYAPVPAYSAAYVPPAAATLPAPAPIVGEDRTSILEALRRIEERLNKLEGLPPGSPPPPPDRPPDRPPTTPPTTPPAVKPKDPFAPIGPPAPATLPASKVGALFQQKCAACHDRSVFSTKGGNFMLTEGGHTAPLSDRQARRVASQVYTGRMPKGGPKLSDQEVAEVMEWIDGLK